MRLALFALVSEVPWNLWHTGHIIWLGKQSVFVTLCLSYLGLCAPERLQVSADASERRRTCAALVGPDDVNTTYYD